MKTRKLKAKNATIQKKQLVIAMIKEIKQSILLSEQEKHFWIDHASSLPSMVVMKVIKLVRPKNKQVQKYLKAALAKDPGHIYLSKLKAKIKFIIKNAFTFEEKNEKEGVEELLEKQIENL